MNPDRIRQVTMEAIARAEAVRDAAEARRMKASGGLPIPAMGPRSGGSIVQGRARYRTAGKR